MTITRLRFDMIIIICTNIMILQNEDKFTFYKYFTLLYS